MIPGRTDDPQTRATMAQPGQGQDHGQPVPGLAKAGTAHIQRRQLRLDEPFSLETVDTAVVRMYKP
jgi:hypothetical protein